MKSGLSTSFYYFLMKKYSDKIRQEVTGLIKSGESKLEASRRFGIPYRTVIEWTFGICIKKRYPKHLREKVRALVRKGLSKVEASKATGVNYASVLKYTNDIRTCRNAERINGTTLKLLRELVKKGHVFDDKNPVNRTSYKTLKKYFPVKRVKSRRITVFYLDGSERTALEAFLERLNWRSIDYRKLAYIRQAFGIKKMKRKALDI
jgi:hypothetical protein